MATISGSGNSLGVGWSNLALLLLLLPLLAVYDGCRFTIIRVFTTSLLLQKRERLLANMSVVNCTGYLQQAYNT